MEPPRPTTRRLGLGLPSPSTSAALLLGVLPAPLDRSFFLPPAIRGPVPGVNCGGPSPGLSGGAGSAGEPQALAVDTAQTEDSEGTDEEPESDSTSSISP